MTAEFAGTEFMLLVIAAFSACIAWEFYKSKDGRLRILVIELFLAKIWVYGGACLMLLFFRDTSTWMRVALNLPMFIIMIRLYAYVRGLRRD